MMTKVGAVTLIMTVTMVMMMMTTATKTSEERAVEHHQLPKRHYTICSGPSNVPVRVCTKTAHSSWLGTTGTDSDISISLGGSKCHTTWQDLDNAGNDFMPNALDCFNFNTQNLGPEVTSVRIHSDMSGVGPGWELDYVKTRYKNSDQKTTCRIWWFEIWIEDTYDKERTKAGGVKCF
ncbi:hypothetical protein V1264_023819 [Littorina saxatilis]|uniref:PLAT domain-containing protein n=1 Tax=Littorina saxatilis TaxID=31220 RepID=A0AAN9BCG6_9CAEN